MEFRQHNDVQEDDDDGGGVEEGGDRNEEEELRLDVRMSCRTSALCQNGIETPSNNR